MPLQFTTSDFGPSFYGGRNGRFPRESMAETKARAAVECADEGDAALYECVAENAAAERVSVATRVSVVGGGSAGAGACFSSSIIINIALMRFIPMVRNNALDISLDSLVQYVGVFWFNHINKVPKCEYFHTTY